MQCTYFLQSQCTSCHLLDKSYPETLAYKEEKLKNLFPDQVDCFKPTIGLGNVEKSRSKAKFSVFMQNGEITFGLTNAQGQYQELEHCPLHAQGVNELLPILKAALVKYKIIPYDIKNKKGELKFVLITKSDENSAGEFLIRFVLRSKESLDRLRKAAAELIELPNMIKVVTANIQPVHQAILEGDEEIVLSPEQAIIHQFDEFQLALGARSFFQVTPEIAKQLYGAVANSISLDKPGSLIDLYCGVGAFSFYASRGCENVTGVEISKDAIDCARTSARLNNSHVEFHAVDVESFLLDSNKKFDAVIVNPPRRGLNAFIINKIKQIEPDFIYYSSCNPETLARDYSDFKDGYEIKSLQIFDMFPYTRHFETLMCLSRI
ncbi:MAG: 23S rRNA (uracil(1939)-C(5))-methyltransferase RlmD [Gammaproteobacteria bacterium]|nr:23S rRNA (uracil(1939)-C(5))-methyltransferase RlmD [Gammaproteobacteria bacterium]